nr:uncharacterized protein LOC113809222 [Penaeus vannamei]
MSWRRRICDLNHIKTNTHDPRRRRLLKKPQEVVLKNIAATSSIVTVRHPLTRLVSCYRDKFENGAHPSLHERHWRDFYMPTLFCNGRIPPDLHLKIGLQRTLSNLQKKKTYVDTGLEEGRRLCNCGRTEDCGSLVESRFRVRVKV